MRRSRRVMAWIVWISLLIAGPAAGQSLSSGSIDGRVASSAGAAVQGAMVTVVHERSGATRSIVSPREGRFGFVGLPPGEYLLLAEQIGFQPQALRGIVLRPGQQLHIEVTLPALSGVAERVDTLDFAGAELAGRGAAVRLDLDAERLRRLPNEQNDLREVARLSSLGGAELEIQGQPASMASLRVDGVGLFGLDSPAFLAGASHAAAFPLGMFEIASLAVSNPDVEWGGGAGGALEGITLRGGRDLEVEAFGLGGIQSRGSAPAGLADSGQRFDSGLRVSGPLIRDTANFAVGLQFTRQPESPLAHATTATAFGESSEIARDLYGLAVPSNPSGQTLAAFARVGWQMTGSTQVDAWGSFASTSSGGGRPLFQSYGSHAPGYDGRDLFAGLTLSSRISDRFSQEARLVVESLSRTADPSDGLALAGTAHILTSAVRLGAGARQPSALERVVVRASETLHLAVGLHRLKFGLSGAFVANTVDPGRISEAVFADEEDFSVGLGYTVRSPGLRPRVRFDTPQLSLFAQETWVSPSGISLLLGLRTDMERLPVSDVRLNDDWFDVSGLRNTDVNATSFRVSPRFGLAWDVQNRNETILSASAGVYSGFTDPLLLGEWIAGSGGSTVVRHFGTDGGWPDGPVAVGGHAATPLFLLGRDAAGARTVRADVGFIRAIRPRTSLHLRAYFRDTAHLPLMNDLNRPQPNAQDLFGRPIFGELRQHGALLYVEPGTNRRFPGFDQVSAVDFNGWSTYKGLTTALEHGIGTPMALVVSYTYSTTEDNWVPGLGGTYPSPSGAIGSSWMEGRSDFDVPHRLVAAVETTPDILRGGRLALLYRYRSGDPFTPRLSEGLDIDGDGWAGNEPAFVERMVPGMDELIGGWDCLRDQIGRFVERNSCRTGGVHSLDASVGAVVARGRRVSAELLFEAINILDGGRPVPDAALYHVDPDGVMSIVSNVVDLPLMVNPNFGRSRGVAVPGRTLRIGFRLTH